MTKKAEPVALGGAPTPRGDDTVPVAHPVEPAWFAWAMISHGPAGFRWVRMRLPQSVVEKHRIGPVQPPDLRPNVAALIENEMLSDRIVDGRGWERR